LRFECFDVLTQPDLLLALVQNESSVVIFIDIGGTRERDTVVNLIEWAKSSIKPRLIVVKNVELRQNADEYLTKFPLDHGGVIPDGEEWWKLIKEEASHGVMVTTAQARIERRKNRVASRTNPS